MIIGVIYYFFFKPITIGNDQRYNIYIFWLPTILGIIILGIYRRKFLKNRFNKKKNFNTNIIDFFYFLIQGVFFSYLSFGQISNITWEILNYNEAKKNQKENIECEIERFWIKKRPTIDFKFNGKIERLRVKYSDIKQYSENNVENYKIKISARKGIWNYYLVEEFEIKE